jgi:hypothetical protein
MDLDPRLESCLPKRLHPVSRYIMDIWLAGDLPTHEFRRLFHLPNSRYLSVSACLVAAMARINGSSRGKT